MLDCLKQHEQGTVISLFVQPRSSRNQIVGLHEDSLKVKLTSPPVEGAANKCCCGYLSKLFKLPKSSILLVAGDRSRQKRFLLHGLQPDFVESIIKEALSRS